MSRLQGKVAVITGGARGQGAAHAKRFVEEGARVVITDLLKDEGEALAKQLGENVLFVEHNVASASDWDNVVKVTEETFGPIQILVNNAGISMSKPLEEVSEADFRKVIDVNQMSVFFSFKSVVPSMQKAQGGSIINISSVAGLVGSPNNIAYTASKFAMRGMSKAGAGEFAKYGIRVNSIHPGMIQTPMFHKPDWTEEQNRKAIESITSGIPLKRLAQPEEVTNLVVYLASDESTYSTGAEFIVDGGLTAVW